MGTWSQHFSNVEGSFDLVECDRCAALVRKDVTPTKKHTKDHEDGDKALRELQQRLVAEPERRYVGGIGWGNR